MAKTTPKKVLVKGAVYGGAVKKINGMSTDEFRATLQRLGISKANGDLTVKYVLKKKTPKTMKYAVKKNPKTT